MWLTFGLLAIWLTACGGSPDAPPPGLEVRYYSTHQGRPPLSWELKVWTPNRGTLKATYTDASPGGIVEGFRWSVRGDGNCEQMRFQAVPAKVDIAARDIVQLLVDGEPAFYGYVETAWPAGDGEKREYVAIGAASLMRVRYTDGRKWPSESYPDVADIVRDALNRWLHPGIASTDVRDTGGKVDASTPGPIPVAKLLDDLAEAARTTWGVDASGTLFFSRPGQSAAVGYAEHGLRWLPIEGEEVVTQVIAWGGYRDTGATVRVETPSNSASIETNQGRTPLYLVAYTAPEHSTYGASRAFTFGVEIAEYGVDGSVAAKVHNDLGGIQVNGTGVGYCGRVSGSEKDLVDGNTSTYLRLKIGNNGGIGTGWYEAIISFQFPEGFWPTAWELDFAFSSNPATDSALSAFVRVQADKGGGLFVPRDVAINAQSGTIKVYGGPLANIEGIHVLIDPATYTCSGTAVFLDLKELRVWGMWMPSYEEAAKSLIRLPSQTPAEVEWQGYQPPARYLAVTGAPGGDLTGEVETWEYEWTPRRMRSVARMGSRGADAAARAIRLLADRRREEAEGTALALTRRR